MTTASPHVLQRPLNIGLVGMGKIARDQHIPALRANPAWQLVAGCSTDGAFPGLASYPSMAAMFDAHPEIDAVAICTPPQVRQALARAAMAAGKHVFLEKPPAATMGEAEALAALARACGVSLLAAWHSRFALAVERARAWCQANPIARIDIVWKEDVRQWHPGQAWIFQPGGSGVFDPAINSLSILTALLDEAVIVRAACMYVPANCATPIRAELTMATQSGIVIGAEYDFLESAEQRWSILVTARCGARLALHRGGEVLELNGQAITLDGPGEYPGLYSHFHTLIRTRQSDADFAPLRIVADAFMIGQAYAVEPFHP